MTTDNINSINKIIGKTSLWNVITKENMENNSGETITDEEWEKFVVSMEKYFDEGVGQLALDLWYNK